MATMGRVSRRSTVSGRTERQAPTLGPWPAFACPGDGNPLTEAQDHVYLFGGPPVPDRRWGSAVRPGHHLRRSFREQWKRYRLTQLDSIPVRQSRATDSGRCFGDPLWDNLDAPRCRSNAVGGAGRFTEVLLDQGARVTSIDLERRGRREHRTTFPIGPMHRVAQADIVALPFEKQRFDVVACIGVIQHTPSPGADDPAAVRSRTAGWTVDHRPLHV